MSNLYGRAGMTGIYGGITFSRVFEAGNIRRQIQQMVKGRDHYQAGRRSIADGNRHGGPHLHQREIARRQRQQRR